VNGTFETNGKSGAKGDFTQHLTIDDGRVDVLQLKT
jgi:hypothetical protein